MRFLVMVLCWKGIHFVALFYALRLQTTQLSQQHCVVHQLA